jgi:uncharacterized protein YecT (DUF1311 family)
MRKMSLRKIILFCLGSVLPLAVMAKNCGDFTNQVDMNACAATELQKQDKQLNKVYNDYRARLSSEQKQQLKEVQTAWLKFRDLSCKFQSSGVEGGSVYPFILQSCLTSMTQDRLKVLQYLSKCEEGDLSCPVPER